MSAVHAQAQVYPGVAAFQALFAALGMRLDVVYLIEMRAFRHYLNDNRRLELALKAARHGSIELHGREAGQESHHGVHTPGDD